MQVEGNGYKVELHYFVAVVVGEEGKSRNPICKGESKGFIWKISTAPNAVPTATNLDLPADAAYSLSLPASFLGIDYTRPIVTFTNLTGAALGSIQGKGADALLNISYCKSYSALYLRWSRRELRTTEMELNAMAADAIIGLSLPSAATGMATVL